MRMVILVTLALPAWTLLFWPNSFWSTDSPDTPPDGRSATLQAGDMAPRDIYPDTWVGTDALGRVLPTSKEVGPVKSDHPRVVGIFYVTWHRDRDSNHTAGYVADVTKVLNADPNARLDDKNPVWKSGITYHWGEPELGYFLSKDRYVIRKDMSMLADAGIDVLVMDVTNAERYWDEWDAAFSVMEEMRAEGNIVPKFCFWAFNGPVYTVVQELYERLYQKQRYRDLWFYWEGKPLLLYNDTGVNDGGEVVKSPNPHFDSAAATNPDHPHFRDPYYTERFYTGYTPEVTSFFTARTMWWGFFEWNGSRFIGTEKNWSYGYQLNDERVKALSPKDLVSHVDGIPEQAAVTPAQHAPTNLSMAGKSWSRKFGEPSLNEYDLPDSAYVSWLGRWVTQPEGYGIYFQERWEDALLADPHFIYLNDWNEWKAHFYQIPNGKTTPFMRRESPFFFVDQYNAEFNRDIQPMKDGYTDNFYMQMVGNIRRYKGVRPIPVLNGMASISIDGEFSDWSSVNVEYQDTRGDTMHRAYNGYYGKHYKDSTGRNDIVTCKVAVDEDNVYFYAETANVLSPSSDQNWMLLLIDADKNPETGWYGYDVLINQEIVNQKTTALMGYSQGERAWSTLRNVSYRYAGRALELAVPRTALGYAGKDRLTFDFHWSDNPPPLKDPISFCTGGDSAPNRRFNFRCIWNR